MPPQIVVPKHRDGVVRQEGTNVQILIDGRLVMELTWESALGLAKELNRVGHLAEELAKVEQVIEDQAILYRSGLMLPLVTNPAMAKEAANKAHWDTPLRRYIRTNKMANGIVYNPTVYHEPKKKKE